MSTNLLPGTAMNVTLKANYTKTESQYKAKLKTFYADSDESKTRDIEATVSRFKQKIFNFEQYFHIFRSLLSLKVKFSSSSHYKFMIFKAPNYKSCSFSIILINSMKMNCIRSKAESKIEDSVKLFV